MMFRIWLIGLYLVAALLATACSGIRGTPETPPRVADPATSARVSPIAAATPTAAPKPNVGVTLPASPDELVRLAVVPEQSEARYRAREQLVRLPLPSDAIGVTKSITGTIVGKRDGTIVSSLSKISVDLRTLQSNERQRDNFLRQNVLQTDRYPYAEFVPIAAPGLPLSPPESGAAEFQLIGDLTIRNVTKRVTWNVKGNVVGDEATVQANTSFTFSFFNLTQPQVPVVLSIVDNIRLEVDLRLRRL